MFPFDDVFMINYQYGAIIWLLLSSYDVHMYYNFTICIWYSSWYRWYFIIEMFQVCSIIKNDVYVM